MKGILRIGAGGLNRSPQQVKSTYLNHGTIRQIQEATQTETDRTYDPNRKQGVTFLAGSNSPALQARCKNCEEQHN